MFYQGQSLDVLSFCEYLEVYFTIRLPRKMHANQAVVQAKNILILYSL